MNFNAMIDSVLAKTGNWTDTSLRTQVLNEMILAQQEMETAPEVPWFLYEESTLTLTAGSETVALPSGFIRIERDFSYVTFTFADKRYYPKALSVDEFREYATGLTAGDIPLAYTIIGSNLLFAPQVTANLSITLYAPLRDTVPTDAAATNGWATECPSVLIYATAARIAGEQMQDAELENRMLNKFAASWDTFKRHNFARREEFFDWVKGDD